MKKILIVSTFPPRKCGIGTYAYSQAKHYKNLGYEITTLGLGNDSSSHQKLNFNKKGILKISKWLTLHRFDEIHLHFVDGFFNFDKDSIAKITLFKLFSVISKNFTIIVHEIIPNIQANISRATALSFADKIEVHTEKEKKATELIFQSLTIPVSVAGKNIGLPVGTFLKKMTPIIEVVEHDRYFSPYFLGSQEQARRMLNLDLQKKIIVSLGFIQQHKGFDRVIDAMELLDGDEIQYFIVGSKREEVGDIIEYYNYLEDRVGASEKSINIVHKFLSDEEFDIWIRAADALILPYREIWSSGVGARAKLLDCPVIASNLPTLVEQLAEQVHYIFNDEQDLSEILLTLPKKEDLSYVDENCAPTSKKDVLDKKPIKSVMIIAPVLTNKFVGGAEVVIKDFISILSQSGEYSITVISTKSDSVSDFNNKESSTNSGDFGWGDNVKIIRFKTITPLKKIHRWAHSQYNQSSGLIMNNLWKYSGLTGFGLIGYVKKHIDQYDLIYIPHYLYPVSHQLIKHASSKNIVHPFVHDEPALNNINNIKFFQCANSIVVNSDAEKYILDKYNIPFFCHLKEIGNRVDYPVIKNMPNEQNDLLNKLGIEPKKYIFYIGRISKMKNVDDLLYWHKTLLERTSLKVDLVIAGKGDPCGMLGWSDLPAGIKYAGFISDDEKNILIHHSLAVTQLSILESFSLVVIESWLAKVPVIAHKNCLPIKYNFEKSQNPGFLVGEESEYIKAVESLVFMSKTNYQKLGDKGYEFASKNFVPEVFNQKLIGSFNSLISEE